MTGRRIGSWPTMRTRTESSGCSKRPQHMPPAGRYPIPPPSPPAGRRRARRPSGPRVRGRAPTTGGRVRAAAGRSRGHVIPCRWGRARWSVCAIPRSPRRLDSRAAHPATGPAGPPGQVHPGGASFDLDGTPSTRWPILTHSTTALPEHPSGAVRHPRGGWPARDQPSTHAGLRGSAIPRMPSRWRRPIAPGIANTAPAHPALSGDRDTVRALLDAQNCVGGDIQACPAAARPPARQARRPADLVATMGVDRPSKPPSPCFAPRRQRPGSPAPERCVYVGDAVVDLVAAPPRAWRVPP